MFSTLDPFNQLTKSLLLFTNVQFTLILRKTFFTIVKTCTDTEHTHTPWLCADSTKSVSPCKHFDCVLLLPSWSFFSFGNVFILLKCLLSFFPFLRVCCLFFILEKIYSKKTEFNCPSFLCELVFINEIFWTRVFGHHILLLDVLLLQTLSNQKIFFRTIQEILVKLPWKLPTEKRGWRVVTSNTPKLKIYAQTVRKRRVINRQNVCEERRGEWKKRKKRISIDWSDRIKWRHAINEWM